MTYTVSGGALNSVHSLTDGPRMMALKRVVVVLQRRHRQLRRHRWQGQLGWRQMTTRTTTTYLPNATAIFPQHSAATLQPVRLSLPVRNVCQRRQPWQRQLMPWRWLQLRLDYDTTTIRLRSNYDVKRAPASNSTRAKNEHISFSS